MQFSRAYISSPLSFILLSRLYSYLLFYSGVVVYTQARRLLQLPRCAALTRRRDMTLPMRNTSILIRREREHPEEQQHHLHLSLPLLVGARVIGGVLPLVARGRISLPPPSPTEVRLDIFLVDLAHTRCRRARRRSCRVLPAVLPRVCTRLDGCLRPPPIGEFESRRAHTTPKEEPQTKRTTTRRNESKDARCICSRT
jgi:hypothetical protein